MMPAVPDVVVGCDIQDVPSVDLALRSFGTRYLHAILHPEELPPTSSGNDALPSPAFVAGRFAAKEAVFKILGASPLDAVPWPTIRIRHSAAGPVVELHGTAADLAQQRQLGSMSVSISHTNEFSMAVATAARQSSAIQSLPSNSLDPTKTRSDSQHGIGERNERPFMNSTDLDATIRSVLSEHARLGVDALHLPADADLYAAGMTSHASVSVMLALEDALDIEFPESALSKSTFASIEAIQSTLVSALDD